MYYYKNVKKIETQFKQNNLVDDNLNNQNYNNIFNPEIDISGDFKLNELDITLIDNSTGSYYPFLNLSLTQFNTQMINRNNLTINVSLELNSFNYIACVWEPSIERTKLNLNI